MRHGTPPLAAVIVLGVLGIAASGASLVIWSSRATTAVLGVGIVIFLGIALFNSRRDAGRPTAWAALGIALLFVLLIIGSQAKLLQRAFPVCGDGVCAGGECSEGCADCKPLDCDDGICQTSIERCDTSDDCTCPVGALCAPGRKSDAYGCASVSCGDGYCDGDEGSIDCCADCGCASGYACIRNICLFQEPEVTFQPYLYFRNASATTLAANPFLTDAKSVPHPLAAIIVRDDVSPARDMIVEFRIPPYIAGTVDVGDLDPGESANATWYLRPSPESLAIIGDLQTSVNITIIYYDLQGVKRTIRRSYPFTVLGRNTLDEHGELAFFVTPEDVTIKGNDAREIWEELRGTVSVREDDGLISFPSETIAYREGDPTDIAILLVSAYTKAGLEPGFVHTDEGLLVWVREGTDFAVLNPAAIGDQYAPREHIGSLQEVQLVHRVWSRQYISPLSLGMDMIPGMRLDVSRDLTQSCSRTVVAWDVQNLGNVPTPLCADSVLDWTGPVDSREWCFTLAPGERRTLNHGWSHDGEECIRPQPTLLVMNATGERI